MLKLCLALICLGFATQINGENVPAFVFGDKPFSHFPTLDHLNGNEFATMIRSQAKDTLTVVFVENKLSVEDFSQCRLKSQTCFENLNNVERKSYLSSIEQPVDALMSAFNKRKSVTVSSENDLKEAQVDDENILFVYFDEVESNEDFYKHDALISKLFSQLKEKYGNIVAIYTGIHPSFTYSETLKRHKRDAEAAPADEKPVSEKPVDSSKEKEDPKPEAPIKPKQQDDEEKPDQTIFRNPHALIALSEFKVENITVDLSALTVTSTLTETNLTVVLTSGNHRLTLYTISSGGSWHVVFFYNDELYHSKQAAYGFGEQWSFGCTRLVIENPQRSREIQLSGFQYLPGFSGTFDGDTLFTDFVNDCVGFFSPAIWGALFVVILFLSIMSWGLMNMMDIRTMDRFDDPKGKTIIVNAQE